MCKCKTMVGYNRWHRAPVTKICSCHCLTIKPIQTVPWSNPGCNKQKSANNCLCHGMAMTRSFLTILNLKMYKTMHVIHHENILDLLLLFSQSNYKCESLTWYSPQIQLKIVQMYTVQLFCYAICTGQCWKLKEKLYPTLLAPKLLRPPQNRRKTTD